MVPGWRKLQLRRLSTPGLRQAIGLLKRGNEQSEIAVAITGKDRAGARRTALFTVMPNHFTCHFDQGGHLRGGG